MFAACLVFHPWFYRSKIFGENYKLRSSSLCNFPVTACPLSPDIVVSDLFLHTLSLCSSVVRDQVSHPYKTIGKITVVGIALGYGLDDRNSRVRFPAGAGNFSLHHRVQNGSGAHPTSYPMGTRGSFPGGKAAAA
jgi:hypothetical protein